MGVIAESASLRCYAGDGLDSCVVAHTPPPTLGAWVAPCRHSLALHNVSARVRAAADLHDVRGLRVPRRAAEARAERLEEEVGVGGEQLRHRGGRRVERDTEAAERHLRA
eukprot:4140972-Prymnesium_polylepis.1